MIEESLRRKENEIKQRFEEIDKREKRVSILEDHTRQYEDALRIQRDQLNLQKAEIQQRSRELNLREMELDDWSSELEDRALNLGVTDQKGSLGDITKEELVEKFRELKEERGGHMSHMKNIGSDIGNAVAEGGKLVLADQFNEILVDLMKTAAIKGGVAPEILELDAVHTALKFFAPFMMKVATEYAPDMIPASGVISSASNKAIEMVTIQTILPMVSELRPKFAQMAAVAKKLEGSYDDADPAPEGTPSVTAREEDTIFDQVASHRTAEKVGA